MLENITIPPHPLSYYVLSTTVSPLTFSGGKTNVRNYDIIRCKQGKQKAKPQLTAVVRYDGKVVVK